MYQPSGKSSSINIVCEKIGEILFAEEYPLVEKKKEKTNISKIKRKY